MVDLGAGTGKLTRELAVRFRRVIAVDPLEEMLAELRRVAPGVEARRGTAEAIPLPDDSVNAVLAAQAFHWFDGPQALDEIARVVRTGGGLGLLWNLSPWEAREGTWFSALWDLLDARCSTLSTRPRHSTGTWREALNADRRFAGLSSASVANLQRTTPADFVAGIASRSYVLALDEAERGGLLHDLEKLLAREDAPREGDQIVVPMRTDVYWARLL